MTILFPCARVCPRVPACVSFSGRCGLKNRSVPCLRNAACGSKRCEWGDFKDFRSCRGKSEDGGDCDSDTDCVTGACEPYALLDMLGGVCGTDLPQATPCAADGQCASGRCLYSLGSGQQCAAKVPDGGSCVDSKDCASSKAGCVRGLDGGALLTGICGADLKDGTACATGDQCTSRRCDKKICQPKLPPGSSCNENSDCIDEGDACRSYGADWLEIGGFSLQGGVCGNDGSVPEGRACANDDMCSTGRCAREGLKFHCCPKLVDGMQCSAESDCTSGVCNRYLSVGALDLSGGVCGAPGSLPLESLCVGDEQCQSARCIGFILGKSKCAAKLGEGAECSSDDDCAESNCVEWATLNGRCGPKANGVPCLLDESCSSKRCDFEGVNRVCIGKVSNGVECNEHDDCRDGTCHAYTAGVTLLGGVCGGAATLDDAQRCADSEQCKSVRCDAGTCKPKLEGGKECDHNDDCSGHDCRAHMELFGHAFAGVCGTELEVGKSCAVGDQCASKRCERGTCEPRLADGSPCDRNEDCSSPAGCKPYFVLDGLGGVCGTNLPVGAKCTSSEQCAPPTSPLAPEGGEAGRCEGSLVLRQAVCQTKVGDGVDCDEDQDCLSGVCAEALLSGKPLCSNTNRHTL